MPMSTLETDAVLIQKAKGSDHGAVSLLLIRYERELAAFIERELPAFVRSRTSADDMRQITWEEAYKTIAHDKSAAPQQQADFAGLVVVEGDFW